MEKRKCLCVILWKAKSSDADQKVLLLKLRPERGSYWQPVTGHVEDGEDFPLAALREAQEESGIHFERTPQYLGMEYHFKGRFGDVVERAYAIWVYGQNPPTPNLDSKEHVDYCWVSPQEAEDLLFYPSNKEALKRACRPVSPILLSQTGAWYQEGEEITHARTVDLFHQSLVKMGENYLVKIAHEEAEVVVEDVPRFIRSYDAQSGTIFLLGNYEEILDPTKLFVGKKNILYCYLRNGWQAKFLRSAYYEIAKDIEESASGEHLLHFLGGIYRIPVSH